MAAPAKDVFRTIGFARPAAAGVGALLLVLIGGCYERVIGAKGLGAGGTTIHKPYASDTALDRAVMGPPQKTTGTRRIKSAQWGPSGK